MSCPCPCPCPKCASSLSSPRRCRPIVPRRHRPSRRRRRTSGRRRLGFSILFSVLCSLLPIAQLTVDASLDCSTTSCCSLHGHDSPLSSRHPTAARLGPPNAQRLSCTLGSTLPCLASPSPSPSPLALALALFVLCRRWPKTATSHWLVVDRNTLPPALPKHVSSIHPLAPSPTHLSLATNNPPATTYRQHPHPILHVVHPRSCTSSARLAQRTRPN
jgi:hypothetical protein